MEETPADRLRVAIGLHGLGVEMYRQRQRREHPDWGDDEVDAAVHEWLTADRFRIGASSVLNDLLMQYAKLYSGHYGRSEDFSKE